MQYPPITQGLDQTSHLSSDAWEELFRLALDYADVIRQRRAARLAMLSPEPEDRIAHAVTQPEEHEASAMPILSDSAEP